MADEVLEEHGGVDVLVNNAGRSIRRSVKLSYDRFHDYERTMQLNYFGAVRLILMLLPSMTARRRGHIINVSSIGVQTNTPAVLRLRGLQVGAGRVSAAASPPRSSTTTSTSRPSTCRWCAPR
jgi:NAD(P)-dependent dehydrogenase (short-subunit alcohol dehydrogenase family)